MVREDVNALLFDEPLTVIDPHLKWELRTQLKSLHHEFGHTMIYVTHDQTEALTFADKVVVMYDGRVVQIGTPEELFETPEHTFVGYFIGSPGMNLLDAKVEGASAQVDSRGIGRSWPWIRPGQRQGADRGAPEFVRLANGGAGLPATIDRVEDVGRHKIVRLSIADDGLSAILAEGEPVPSSDVRVTFDPSKINVYAMTGVWRLLKSKKGRRPDEQDRQSKGVVPGSADAGARRLLGGDPADDGRELFGSGHVREQCLLPGRPGMVPRDAAVRSHVGVLRSAVDVFRHHSADPDPAWRLHRAQHAQKRLLGLEPLPGVMSLPLLIPWNVVGTIWQIFGRVDIGLLGYTLEARH
jgi:hypothetical protein